MEREPLLSSRQKQWLLRIAGILAFALMFKIYTKSDESASKIESCKKFHYGTFTYYSTLNTKHKIITIKNGLHIERNTKDSSYIRSAIRWFSDCHYRLEVLEVSSKDPSIQVGDLMEIKIDHSIKDTSFFISKRGRFTKKGKLVKLN